MNQKNQNTMKTRFSIITATAAVALLSFTSGCVSPTIKTTRLNPGPDASQPKAVAVHKKGEAVPSNYEVLGAVTALGVGVKTDNKSTLKKLQAEAAAMGADALIGYYTDREKDVSGLNWASALAVRTLPNGQTVPARKGDYMVAVPHTLLDKDVATGGRAEKLDKTARKFAQFYLAQKGYYSILVEEPMPDPFESGFQEMDSGGLVKYGGSETDLVLGVQFVEKKGVTVILVSGHGVTLETALYSKSQKKVIWHNTGTGAGAAGWIIDMTMPNAKRMLAIQAALQKAFETLPDISTKTTK